MSFYKNYFDLIETALRSVDPDMLDEAVGVIKNVSSNGGKIIVSGNGGSAAIASHVAVDLTKSSGTRAINFNEADLITSFANDFGYEHWLEEALKAYADPTDAVVLLSSSGRSENILNAARVARDLGLTVITFSGFSNDNPLCSLGHLNFWVDSKGYNIIEMTHHIWLVAMIDRIIGKIEYSA